MKVSKRSFPMDALSVQEGDYKLSILTHHSKLIVTIEKDGREIFSEWLTLAQIITLIMTNTGR